MLSSWSGSRYVQFVGVVIPTLFLSSLTRSDRYGRFIEGQIQVVSKWVVPFFMTSRKEIDYSNRLTGLTKAYKLAPYLFYPAREGPAGSLSFHLRVEHREPTTRVNSPGTGVQESKVTPQLHPVQPLAK